MIDPSVHNIGRGIHKDIQYPGKGPLPDYQKDTKAIFHFRTYINDAEQTLVDDSRAWDEPFELIFGHNFSLESWENGVKSMRPGERSKFYCQPEKCMGYAKLSKTLRDIQKKKDNKDAVVRQSCCGSQSTGYHDLDKLTAFCSCDFRLTLGNNHFKAKNMDKAEINYAKAIGTLEQLGMREQPQSELWNKIEDMKIPLLLNYSQVMLVKKEYTTAIMHLNTVLKRDPENVKGLYRRATAHSGSWNIEQAERDWTELARVDPSQSNLDLSNITIFPALKRISELRAAVKQKEVEEKARLKGMF
eukprot:sb/3467321/